VESTENYVLMTAVVMVINFLVYDRFVFGKAKKAETTDEKTASKKSED